jgi:tetratricopeptide (TPR) repeat protein
LTKYPRILLYGEKFKLIRSAASALEVGVRQIVKILLVAVTIGLTGVVIAWAATEPRTMSDEVFEILSKGYKNLPQSKFDAAQVEYEKVIKIDFDNPYANNNLAVIMEKQGKLTDAMTYLNIGEKFAAQYLYKVDTAYLFGDVCAAVNPEKATGEKSQIAQVIAENKKKLAEKMGAAPLGMPTKSE